ncbi:zinc knuckle [Ancylostoma ceylanicum]|uniref:Zinc knuckle n=1 Tax=Ancylostoma ceylanicum TaxID=53326 RepID=A0A0D6LNY5_9BILA|nr:zinc knuckle [Ancylostoma ceylanicum]
MTLLKTSKMIEKDSIGVNEVKAGPSHTERDSECWNCGRVGHTSGQCRSKAWRCSSCKGKGHKEKYCERATQYRNRSKSRTRAKPHKKRCGRVVLAASIEVDVKQVFADAVRRLPVTAETIRKHTEMSVVLRKLKSFIDSGRWPKVVKGAWKHFHNRRESLSVVQGCVMLNDRVVIPETLRTSNGQAERFVDILKRGIKKLKGEGSPTLRPNSDCLYTVLLAYRTTPNAALQGKSPAEVFLGRRLRTRLSMLVPTREQPESGFAADRRKQVEAQFNRRHGARSREFSSGDQVMVKSHRGASNFEWTGGIVIKRTGRVTYEVDIGGKHVLRHANQMRKVMSGQKNDTSSSRDLLLDLFETDPVTTESVPDRSDGLGVVDQPEVVNPRDSSENSISGNIEPSDPTTQGNGNGLPRPTLPAGSNCASTIYRNYGAVHFQVSFLHEEACKQYAANTEETYTLIMQLDRKEDESIQISQLPINSPVKKSISLKGRQYTVELKLLDTALAHLAECVIAELHEVLQEFTQQSLFPPDGHQILKSMNTALKTVVDICVLSVWDLSTSNDPSPVLTGELVRMVKESAERWMEEVSRPNTEDEKDRCLTIQSMWEMLQRNFPTYNLFFHQFNINYAEIVLETIDEKLESFSHDYLSESLAQLDSRQGDQLEMFTKYSMRFYDTLHSLADFGKKNRVKTLRLYDFEAWFAQVTVFWTYSWREISLKMVARTISLNTDGDATKYEHRRPLPGGLYSFLCIQKGLSDDYSMLAFQRPEHMVMGSISLVHIYSENIYAYAKKLHTDALSTDSGTESRIVRAVNGIEQALLFISERWRRFVDFDRITAVLTEEEVAAIQNSCMNVLDASRKLASSQRNRIAAASAPLTQPTPISSSTYTQKNPTCNNCANNSNHLHKSYSHLLTKGKRCEQIMYALLRIHSRFKRDDVIKIAKNITVDHHEHSKTLVAWIIDFSINFPRIDSMQVTLKAIHAILEIPAETSELTSLLHLYSFTTDELILSYYAKVAENVHVNLNDQLCNQLIGRTFLATNQLPRLESLSIRKLPKPQSLPLQQPDDGHQQPYYKVTELKKFYKVCTRAAAQPYSDRGVFADAQGTKRIRQNCQSVHTS